MVYNFVKVTTKYNLVSRVVLGFLQNGLLVVVGGIHFDNNKRVIIKGG